MILCYVVGIGCAIICGGEALGQTQKQEKSTVEKAKKKSGKFKSDLKKLGKILSFKNFFHHSDSSKLAKQYIHQQHKLTKGKEGYRYNVDHKSLGLKVEAYAPSTSFKLEYEVLGWYPYWEKDLYQNLNYSLLTTIAYFDYELDPASGNPTTIHDWETSSMLDSAKANGNQTLLTVTNFGNSNNRRFLNNDKAINTLIEQLKSLLGKQGANGVCLDFEGVAAAQKDDFSKFVLLLSQELKKTNKNYLVYMTVPSVDWEKYLDFEVLIPVVDRFVIMGYGYYGATSKVAGPVDPLNSGKLWEPYNLSTSVDFYIANQVPPSKLILALPYYGVIWDTEGGNKGAKVKSFVGSRTYDYIRTNIPGPVQYDTISQSAWSSYVMDKNQTRFRQCWFDNDSTLAVKLDFIKAKKLAGMGIWALGFDKGYQSLWKVIGRDLTNKIVTGAGGVAQHVADTLANNNDSLPHSSQDSIAVGTSSADSVMNKISYIEASLQKITDYKTLILWIMFFVVFFGGIGFLIAMFQPNTRIFFFGNTAYIVYFAAFILLFLVVMLKWTNIINDLSIALILGFISGGVGIYFIKKIIEQMKRNLP